MIAVKRYRDSCAEVDIHADTLSGAIIVASAADTATLPREPAILLGPLVMTLR